MTETSTSGSGTSVSVKVNGDLLAAFDEWWQSGKYESRSEALRALVRGAVNGHVDTSAPLQPPADDLLAYGYERLVAVANPDGIIRDDTARKACTNGPRNLSKEEVPAMVLKPLTRRGYVTRLSNIYGHTSWKLHGWDS